MSHWKRFWFLRNWEAWLIFGMGVAAALVTQVAWIISLGVIGFLLVLLLEAGLDPRSLMRAVHAEQENRTMSAERARLTGGLKDLQSRNEALTAKNQQLQQELEAAREEIKRLSRQA